MGCGCNKNRSQPRRPAFRPVTGPRPLQGGSAAGASPAEVRAQGLQQAVSIGESRRLDEQRRRLERLRRDAIKRKLNK